MRHALDRVQLSIRLLGGSYTTLREWQKERTKELHEATFILVVAGYYVGMNKDDVQKLAHLARLKLEESELEATAEKVGSILSYVGKLESINVDGVTPTAHVHGFQNVFRKDTVHPSLDIQRVLQNAPDKSGRFIRVPIIIEQEE
jgi:aspartyl-tRNA(Asn)/glutamyl-tRNA(Gln) amidotransferase subunit C